MMSSFVMFAVRWLFNSLGLWVAVSLLGTGYSNIEPSIGATGFLVAGFIFSIINAVLKPVLVVLSLPAILLTIGLFMIIVNGILVYVSLRFVPAISMTFLNSILTGMILSLVNYIVSAAVVVKSDNSSAN